MSKSQHLVLLLTIIILALALLTFILTSSLMPPKEEIPHRSRVVLAGGGLQRTGIEAVICGKLQKVAEPSPNKHL